MIEIMTKESFLIYKSFYEPIKNLSDEQIGRLFRSLFDYQINGTDCSDSDISMAFLFFKNQFAVDERKYERIVERNRINGARGGRPSVKSIDTDISEDDTINSFELFFNKYHEITGLNKTDKAAALKKWKALKKADRIKAFDNISDYYGSLSDKNFCKKARTYLGDKNFNDEFNSATSFNENVKPQGKVRQ